MSEHGRVLAVTDETLGDSLAVAAASSATTLYLDDASRFLESGGQALIVEVEDESLTELLTYTAADLSAHTLTVAATTNAYSVGARIFVYPLEVQRMAYVQPDDSELGALVARVPFTMKPMLPEGIRSETDNEEVVVALDRGNWVVSDIPRTEPTIDGAYVSLVADQVTAANIAAGTITADKLAAELVISSTIKTAAEGQRVELDTDGVRLISDSDNILVNLPTEDGASAVFQGEIVAEELTVEDSTFRGAATLDVGSSMTLAGSQAPPMTAPILTQFVSTAAFDTARSDVNYPRSLWYWADVDDYTYLNGADGATQNWRRTNSAGTSVDFVPLDLPAEFFVHSLVYHEERDRWLGTARKTSSKDWFIVSWLNDSDSPGAYDFRWDVSTYAQAFPMIHKDNGSGTFYLAYGTSLGWLTVKTMAWDDPDEAPYATATVTDTSPGPDFSSGLVAFVRSAADFGATRYVFRGRIATNGQPAPSYYVTDTSLAEQSGSYWDAEGVNWGVAWDAANGYFREVHRTEESWVTYSSFVDSASNQYQIAYSWFDTTGTEHETQLSPRAEIAHLSRRWVTVTWPNIPTGGADDPDSARVYMIDADSDPGTDFGDYYLQGEVASPAQSTTLSAYSTASGGSKAADFGAGTAAILKPGTTTYSAGLLGTGDGFIPIGSVTMWAGPYTEMPTGWLLCDGTAVNRTTYAALHAILKDVGGADAYGWGNGDASTTFNLPDFRTKVPLGVGSGGSSPADAETAAGGVHSTVSDHSHSAGTLVTSDHNQATNTATGAPNATRTTTANHNISGSTGDSGTHAHDAHTYANTALPPYTAINFLIKF